MLPAFNFFEKLLDRLIFSFRLKQNLWSLLSLLQPFRTKFWTWEKSGSGKNYFSEPGFKIWLFKIPEI